MLPDIPVGKSSLTSNQPKCTRRSGRPKKPKSSKEKVLRGDVLEGTSLKPLLILDWSNVQITNYCGAYGVDFTMSVNDCIDHMRLLESSRSYRGMAETSSEVHGN